MWPRARRRFEQANFGLAVRLLIYSLNYYPEPTGTGKYSGEMAAWLAAQGHEVEVLCGLPHYPSWSVPLAYRRGRCLADRINGVSVKRLRHFVPTADRLSTKNRIWLETSFTLAAARYWIPKFLAKRKPDAVVAVMPPLQIGVWPALYCLVRRVPWVLHVQDLQVDAALRLNMLPGGLVGRALYGLERFFLNKANRVSTITEPMRQRIIAKGVPKERTWLFPNWADNKLITPQSRLNDFRAQLGVGADKILVLYAGNMGQKQGLEVILDAAKLLEAHDNIHFLMVGDGATRHDLEQRAKSEDLTNLRFLPLQPKEGLCDMLAAADIHLVVQRRDAADLVMPSKLTNILAAGRPCIATAEEGTALANVLEEHATGILSPPEDPGALADAIQRLAEDEGLRARLGRGARSYSETFLDQDLILEKFQTQLNSLN